MREKIVREWLTKDEFSCIKCGAKGEDIGWREKECEIFCKKCNHILEDKEELEDLVAFVKVAKYSFFFRFAKSNFTPCRHCQEKLEKGLDECNMILGNKDYYPLIELSRTWEIDEKKSTKLREKEKKKSL